MIRMLCLRHGESENAVARLSGALPLANLTARGRAQAAEAGRRLRAEGITRVYASSAARARQTAELLAQELPEADGVVVLPELAEVGLGRHEGAQDPAVRARTAAVLRAWLLDGRLGEAVGDGEDGHTVTTRVVTALTSIATANPGGTVAVVGHVASLTAGLHALCGLGERVWGAPLPYAVPFAVECDGHAWTCPAWPQDG